MFGLKIHDLPTDHSIYRASGARDLFDNPHPRFRWTLQPREDFVSLRLQCVPGQDRDCFSEDFVAGGASAAQIIVIERWEIVMTPA